MAAPGGATAGTCGVTVVLAFDFAGETGCVLVDCDHTGATNRPQAAIVAEDTRSVLGRVNIVLTSLDFDYGRLTAQSACECGRIARIAGIDDSF
jgi:hypothetical protein